MKLILANDKMKASILKFIYKEPLFNLFLIGDIETYGLNTDFMSTYVNEGDEIKVVVLKYNTTLLFYDPNELITEADLREIIKLHKIKNIHISEINFLRFKVIFDEDKKKYSIHEQFISKLDKKYDGDISLVSKSTISDCEAIVKSRLLIDEFEGFRGSYKDELASYKRQLQNPNLVSFIVKKDELVVAHSAISITTNEAAMIGGVFTLNEYRKNGYATQTTAALANWILDKNLMPILFFHNQKAGSIYHKIGFKDFGKVYTIVVN
ncbi:GNAT family N-acetyltransferase [Mycoplasma sp. Mirounga ES2805-ORL]|uniref:GNAT family N-acetyltransferase n=1 Tax=Mycoplasma sp. Mirounga ES2805-ORL TaxID=754514 RepID=UPI00197B2C82|nr:GNAT family N-acetyltransferase [Mycoplasma sp. Mirounga ES2805-ORL]QSF13824.1 GNAT family N-acetyltransferase [Mycoplasma sp. Mirounga ES2805-ORL]